MCMGAYLYVPKERERQEEEDEGPMGGDVVRGGEQE